MFAVALVVASEVGSAVVAADSAAEWSYANPDGFAAETPVSWLDGSVPFFQQEFVDVCTGGSDPDDRQAVFLQELAYRAFDLIGEYQAALCRALHLRVLFLHASHLLFSNHPSERVLRVAQEPVSGLVHLYARPISRQLFVRIHSPFYRCKYCSVARRLGTHLYH